MIFQLPIRWTRTVRVRFCLPAFSLAVVVLIFLLGVVVWIQSLDNLIGRRGHFRVDLPRSGKDGVKNCLTTGEAV